MTARDLLGKAVLNTEMVDRYLDPEARNIWAFDAELGAVVRSCVRTDGVDGSQTITNIEPTGERRLVNYASQPCRINTFGDSFNMSQQVSDGESWQEYLAAHFGEPIRNFGIGGTGVYQQYRRMVGVEKGPLSASNVVLNIFSNDHFRSIYKYRWIAKSDFLRRSVADTVSDKSRTWEFFGNPWPHVHLDPHSGKFQEHDNPYPTPESLYLLCDSDHVFDTFATEFETQVLLVRQGVSDYDIGILTEMAEALGMPVDFSTPDTAKETADMLLETCALRSSVFVLNRVREFLGLQGKKLLVLLSYSERDVISSCNGQPRFDQTLIDYLNEGGIAYVDTLMKHVNEFQSFACSPEDYVKRYYYHGHYNPAGNHFFAFAVKDEMMEWLDPMPPAYDKTLP